MKNLTRYDGDASSAPFMVRDEQPPRPTEFASTLLQHWLLVKPHLGQIAGATLLGVMLTILACQFVLNKWYQASAIIRPASQQGPVSQLAMMLGSSSFSSMLGSMISTSTGLSGQLPSDAAEYMNLLQSYGFTTTLIERHNLGPILERTLKARLRRLIRPVVAYISPASVGPDADLWHWYRDMQGRFDVDFDDKQGSLTLTFLDPDRKTARWILAAYVDDLREKLRERTIADTTAAIRSLEDEFRNTPDALLQQQLAQIVAQEMQQKSSARAEADFAFSVTEPPYVPTKTYEPSVGLTCLVELLVIPLLAFLALEIHARVYLPFQTANQLFQLSSANGRVSLSVQDAQFPNSESSTAPF